MTHKKRFFALALIALLGFSSGLVFADPGSGLGGGFGHPKPCPTCRK